MEFIYAVDPNSYYKTEIAARVKKFGLEGKYKLLECGVEDSDILLADGITEGSMDTVTSIQVLCSVGDVKTVMRAVWKLLKPGGSFVFWEHVRNQDAGTAMVQGMYSFLVEDKRGRLSFPREANKNRLFKSWLEHFSRVFSHSGYQGGYPHCWGMGESW